MTRRSPPNAKPDSVREIADTIVQAWFDEYGTMETSGTEELSASIANELVSAQVRALTFVRNLTPEGIDRVIEDVREGKVKL